MSTTSLSKGLFQVVLTPDMFDQDENLTIKLKLSEFPYLENFEGRIYLQKGVPVKMDHATPEQFLEAYNSTPEMYTEYQGVKDIDGDVITLHMCRMWGSALAGAVSNMANGMYPQQIGTLNLVPRCRQYYQSGRLEFICFDLRHTLDGFKFNRATTL